MATVQPWFVAHGVDGYAEMAGWGAWRRTGDVDASLRPLPLGVLAYLTAGAMIAGALRGAFGVAVIGAMATFAIAVLPYMLMPAVDRNAPGTAAVGVDVGSGPVVLLGLGLAVTIVSWIGYARCVLRPAPRAGA